MICTVHIVLEGLPEHVQEIADALDGAIPNSFEWQDYAPLRGGAEIVLEGSGEIIRGICPVLSGRPSFDRKLRWNGQALQRLAGDHHLLISRDYVHPDR